MKSTVQHGRLVPRRKNGIRKSDGAFWRGERAETIIQARAEQYALEKRSKRRGGGPRKPRSPHAELRRLERALKRRKTLAARQRVQAQIDALKKELKV